MGFGDYVISVPSGAIAAVSPYQPIDLKAGVSLSVRVTIASSPTQPLIFSATPASGIVNDTIYMDITGDNFDNLASVKIVNQSGSEIQGANVNVIGGDTIEADFVLQDAAIGLWDIVITNPGGESTRQVNGFEVK